MVDSNRDETFHFLMYPRQLVSQHDAAAARRLRAVVTPAIKFAITAYN